MVTLTIDNRTVTVPEGTTILEAARSARLDIPTLCYLKDINEIGACRICMVEVEGEQRLVAACDTQVAEGIVVHTNSPRVREARRVNLRLLLAQHDIRCPKCTRSGNCKLQQLTNDYNLLGNHYIKDLRPIEPDFSTPVVRFENRCIRCMRCIQVCDKVQGLGIWDVTSTGSRTTVNVKGNRRITDADCALCGQCITHCPTGALRERDDTAKVWEALNDPEKIVIVQTAPAVRAALGEEFGMPIGTNVEGKMVAALRRLGFDKVFDTDCAADFTIVEEANELVDRVKNGGVLPMITSCSPGWVKFCEMYYPEQIGHLSSCKSPQSMMGGLLKTYYAETNGIDPEKIVSVSVMPCTAKKFEVAREELSENGLADVDITITTRELARMIDRAGIRFPYLGDEEFDELLGVDTGAAVIFGATGGVMEAALRTANDWLTGKDNASVEFHEVRGTQGLKEATYNVGGVEIKVAVASGIANANYVMQQIKDGTAPWTFVEIMCCPGGCVTGGGQPIQPASVLNTMDLKAMRAKALYDQDAAMPMRKSHDNPTVKAVYKEYLGEIGGHKAHEILHTHYVGRPRFR